MHKALCVAAVVAGLLALSGRSSSAAPAPFTSPLIVAKGKVLNQTAPIPTTTIFTPPQTGLYRLSAYATLTQTDPSSASTWQYSAGWTDDAGPQLANSVLFTQGNTRAGQFTWENSFTVGGATVIFEAKTGTPVTYSVAQPEGPDNSAYSLYYTLEHLE